MVKPIERVLRSGLFGPWDRPDIEASTSCPRAQPGPAPGVGRRLVRVLPQLHAAGLGARTGTSRTTTGRRRTTRHIFEGTLYFVPPEERHASGSRQELAAVTFKEYALQDGNTLEATQSMIESRPVTEFPLNDQEILLRHLHKTARRLRRRLPAVSSRRRSRISAAS